MGDKKFAVLVYSHRGPALAKATYALEQMKLFFTSDDENDDDAGDVQDPERDDFWLDSRLGIDKKTATRPYIVVVDVVVVVVVIVVDVVDIVIVVVVVAVVVVTVVVVVVVVVVSVVVVVVVVKQKKSQGT